jgi:hypothetical protein
MKYLSALIAVSSLALAAIASPSKDVQKTLEGNYAAISKAFVDKDFDKFASFLAPDFKGKSPRGIADRAKVIQDFKSQRERMSDIHWTKKITGLKVEGAIAHAQVEGVLTSKMDVGDKKPHTFDLKSVAKDDWALGKDGKWLLKSSETTKLDVKFDGKPIPNGG